MKMFCTFGGLPPRDLCECVKVKAFESSDVLFFYYYSECVADG